RARADRAHEAAPSRGSRCAPCAGARSVLIRTTKRSFDFVALDVTPLCGNRFYAGRMDFPTDLNAAAADMLHLVGVVVIGVVCTYLRRTVKAQAEAAELEPEAQPLPVRRRRRGDCPEPPKPVRRRATRGRARTRQRAVPGARTRVAAQ